ncbi:MAG: histidine phosphatase family protein [Chitinophagales bacterium]|nr:histidine phosphatase family protein [Chitinophagales bacterium]
MQLYIIRHGETDFNKQGILQGRGVNPGLNELGKKQAALFFEKYKSENFEIIYTSSLKRTHDSVASFIEKGIPWEQHAELDEISWGIFEGKVASHEFKMQYRDLLYQWQNGNLDAKPENGESPNEVSARQKKFIDYILSKPEEKILIAMHGRALRIFLPTMLQQDLKMMDEYPHHNLTLYKVIFNSTNFSIDLFNNMDHLH